MNPVHDDDGNVTDYKNMKYSWNAENQLVSSEPKNPSEGDKKTEYLCDYMGRRARKQVYVYSSGGWNQTTEKLFVYDGWNLIKEVTKVGASSSDKFYVWGLDLSQSLQGAGGIGGLVCAVSAGEVRHYFFDGNGNVGQVVNADGSIAAHYEYDPFGNIVNGVPQSDDNPFRFSTKYFDEETGLYYYGFRDYSAELGRWWSRDPIEEIGGINPYAFVDNDPLLKFDKLGLFIKGCRSNDEKENICKKCCVKSFNAPPDISFLSKNKASFIIEAEFEHNQTKGCDAICCEYRQEVKGIIEVNGARYYPPLYKKYLSKYFYNEDGKGDFVLGHRGKDFGVIGGTGGWSVYSGTNIEKFNARDVVQMLLIDDRAMYKFDINFRGQIIDTCRKMPVFSFDTWVIAKDGGTFEWSIKLPYHGKDIKGVK